MRIINNIIKRIGQFTVISLLFITVPINSYCQKLDGYVVLNSGDTLRGKIRQRSKMYEHLMYNYVVFFDRDNEKKKFYTEDIKAYQVEKDQYFVVPILGKKDTIEMIAKRIISGKCELYEYWYVNPTGFNSTSAPILKHYLKKKDGFAHPYNYRKLVKGLDPYFADAPELNFDIQRKKYKRNDIEMIIMKYNNATNN